MTRDVEDGVQQTEFVGDLERAFASAIYPNRVLIAIVAATAIVAWAIIAWRRRWDLALRRHPRGTVAGIIIVVAVAGPLGWYLGSPLRRGLRDGLPLLARRSNGCRLLLRFPSVRTGRRLASLAAGAAARVGAGSVIWPPYRSQDVYSGAMGDAVLVEVDVVERERPPDRVRSQVDRLEDRWRA